MNTLMRVHEHMCAATHDGCGVIGGAAGSVHCTSGCAVPHVFSWPHADVLTAVPSCQCSSCQIAKLPWQQSPCLGSSCQVASAAGIAACCQLPPAATAAHCPFMPEHGLLAGIQPHQRLSCCTLCMCTGGYCAQVMAWHGMPATARCSRKCRPQGCKRVSSSIISRSYMIGMQQCACRRRLLLCGPWAAL
jgi:hypothetical protein